MGQELSSVPGAARTPNKGGGRTDAATRDIEVMDERMKAKLQRGVNYNMKVIVRGATKTGKSQLLRRLQGRPFDSTYVRTSRIQSANINWSYKETHDVVKVEVWDVVDKGFVEQSRAAAFTSRAMSLFQGARALPMTQEEMVADASTVDVYRGTHAVVFTFDITRRDTFDYVKRELPNVPTHIHILLLANFYDLHSKATVKPAEIRDLVRSRNAKRQSSNEGRMYALNASMKDCFGLIELYSLLNIPFLSLKVKALEESVARIHEDMTTYDKEFATRLDQQDYAAHLRLVGQGGAAGLVAVPEPPSPSEPAPLGGATEDPLAAAEEEPPEPPEYVELQDEPLPKKKAEAPKLSQTNGATPAPVDPAPQKPALKLEAPVTQKLGEQTMDDFFDDVELSEPEAEKSEESEEDTGRLARPLDDPGQEEAHRRAAKEASEKAKRKGKHDKHEKHSKKGQTHKKGSKEKAPEAPPPPAATPFIPVMDHVAIEIEARALKLQEEVDALGMGENTLDGFLSDPEESPTGSPAPQATPPGLAPQPGAPGIEGPSLGAVAASSGGAAATDPSDPLAVPVLRDPSQHSVAAGSEGEERDGSAENEEEDTSQQAGLVEDSEEPVLHFGLKPPKPTAPSPAVQLSTEAQQLMAQIAAQMAAEAAREEEERRLAHEAARLEKKEKKEKGEKKEKKEKKEKAEGEGTEKRKKDKDKEKKDKEKKEKRKKDAGAAEDPPSGPIPILDPDDRVELVDVGD
eukprot:EG_transcript_3358